MIPALSALAVSVQATETAGSAADGARHWAKDLLFREVLQGLSVLDIVVALAILVGGWIVSRIVHSAMARAFKMRAQQDVGREAVLQRLTHYLVMLLALFLALNVIGVQLTSLFAAGAVFALVIGFALQNLSENFVSGVILMIERSITPDDVLEVEGRMVKVIKMGIRATVARTRDDEDLIIPNSLLVTSTVKNFTLRDKTFRLRAHVGVAYTSDLKLVRGTLEAAARSVPWRNTAIEPRVLLTGFGASAVDFEISVWIEDPWRSKQLLSDLYEAIWGALSAAGIAIAFPQLDVHFDREWPGPTRSSERVVAPSDEP